MHSSVVRAAVVLLAAVQDDSFFLSAVAKANLEAAGAVGDHKWHLMLPTSARVSPITYSAVLATRYGAVLQTGSEVVQRHFRHGWTQRASYL